MNAPSDSSPNDSPPSGFSPGHPFYSRRFVGAATLLFWLALFIGTHIPLPKLEELPDHSDKLLHFSAYAGLAFLLGWWWSLRGPLRGRTYAALFGIVAVYGVLDELLQQLPGIHRTADVNDVLADWAGAFCGLLVLRLLRKTLRRTDRQE